MIYFDNAATTFPKPEKVYAFTDKFYREYGVNVGRGQHKLAFAANKLVDETRALILQLFNCPAKKVVFTPSATIALNIVLQGLCVGENYNIYLSPFEHNAVTRVINSLQRKFNLNVFELAVDKQTIQFNLEKIKYQFADKKPNIVVMSHASNVCGVVTPIEDICKLSKEYNAVNVVDMAQTAGLIETDLNSNIYDYVVFAGHKTLYSDFGVAGFICCNDSELKPILMGGTGADSANQNMPDTIPEKFEIGSLDIRAISSLYASLNWINEVGIKEIYKKEKENHNKLLLTLRKYKNISIISPLDFDSSIGVVSCVFREYSSDSIGAILNEKDIAVRTGLHCAPMAHKFLNTFPSGTVRFSVSYFNNDIDFLRLDKALEFIYENS
ncbi:aminotransferase class V-fold PLP-dependent enzyme [Candidatus Parcubacteria bacterium]|jgi:cysteine desulfurase family protein|nr:MAG: aminotransferase class V-fold PLP-dependent enzyme [Candidatus Parcubacteria bacterium]